MVSLTSVECACLLHKSWIHCWLFILSQIISGSYYEKRRTWVCTRLPLYPLVFQMLNYLGITSHSVHIFNSGSTGIIRPWKIKILSSYHSSHQRHQKSKWKELRSDFTLHENQDSYSFKQKTTSFEKWPYLEYVLEYARLFRVTEH